jgi:integrase/recombinase XerD
MKEHLKRFMKIRGDLDHDYLFIGRSNKPLKNKSIQDRITLYGNMAQINKRVSPHTFRHTFAKFYITNGGDAFSLQQILGHTSTEMTRKYVLLFGTDLRQMHRKFSPIEGMSL